MNPKTLRFFLSLSAVLTLAAIFAPTLRETTARARATYSAVQTDSAIRERNQSAFAQILGDVRATTSDLMFVKANRYVHAGVGYNLSQKAAAAAVGDEEDLQACADMPTLIRAAGEDFRGFLGALEREVKPYREAGLGHAHTSKSELIPWFRIMTLSNPYFIRGYRVGGLTLIREDKWSEAFEFMDEGVEKNPDNPELFLLYQSLAFSHYRGRYSDLYPWPEHWQGKAQDAAFKCYDLGKQRRPPEGVSEREYRGLIWTTDIEEDFAIGSHLAALLHFMRSNKPQTDQVKKLLESRRIAIEQKDLLPEFPIFERLIRDIDKSLAKIENETEKTVP